MTSADLHSVHGEDRQFLRPLQGHGLNSFRFYEALSLGIPPILVTDNAALPFDDLVEYESFCPHARLREALG